MSAFAKASFDASAYLAHRPTYPESLLKHILGFHEGGYGTLVDVGCGQGQLATALASRFDRVVGADPSSTMTSAALQAKTKRGAEIEYRTAPSEHLDFLGGEVDLVTAGQAAHWFDMASFWKEMERVVKPKGSIALIAYGDPYFDKEEMTTLIRKLSRQDLGPYWQQPGRRLAEDLYRDLAGPPHDSRAWSSFSRLDSTSTSQPRLEPLTKDLTLDALESYVRTWSAAATAKDAEPTRDPVGETFTRLRALVPHREDPITVRWPVGLILARRAGC